MFEKLVFAETKFTIKTKHKRQFKARLTKTVFERPNLLRMDIRRAYGCSTLSSKFRDYSVSHAQPQSPTPDICSNQSCLTKYMST